MGGITEQLGANHEAMLQPMFQQLVLATLQRPAETRPVRSCYEQ
jgi:hypothetical protein